MQIFSLHWMMQAKNLNSYIYILYYQSNIPYNHTPTPTCYPYKMVYFELEQGIGTASETLGYNIMAMCLLCYTTAGKQRKLLADVNSSHIGACKIM